MAGQVAVEVPPREAAGGAARMPEQRTASPEPSGDTASSTALAESDAELVAGIRAAEQSMREALYAQLVRIAEVERRGLHSETGARSVQLWLRELLNLAVGEARNRVHVARAVGIPTGLNDELLLPAVPTAADALQEGDITLAHAGTIVDGLAALPPGVDAVERGEAEALLVREARQVAPHELRSAAERLRYRLDQDGALRSEEYQIDHRELRIGTGRDGMTTLKGRLDRESGARLRAALEPLAAPRRESDGTPDTRSPGKRNADALSDLLDTVLSNEKLPRTGGQRPQLTVTIDFDQLTGRRRHRGSSGGEAPEEASAGCGPGASGSDRTPVFGHGPLVGGTITNTGQPITAASARRLACDAQVLPIVLGGDGQPLDVGRSERTAPAHLRAALLARDGSCAFPGCDHPPGTSQAHHIRHWADGGTTALHNLVMLCGHHHRIIHLHRWDISMAEGRPVFLPPAWMDQERQPRAGRPSPNRQPWKPPG